ncbi:MAG: DUF1697 domain-containing protein [Ignavibacteria bacterium]|nr:DUF1697 domain-containing protein [Ignavibacteria bacterium]
MHTYISLLRGINVSGQKLIKMDALRAMYESLGFNLVRTYLQSGNVLFQSPAEITAELATLITDKIASTFGFEVFVLVISPQTLQEIILNCPFTKDQDKELSSCYVTYLERMPDTSNHESIIAKKLPQDEISFTDKAVYLYCPKGYGTTKLSNNRIESKLKVKATTRNWKTTVELMRMAEEMYS